MDNTQLKYCDAIVNDLGFRLQVGIELEFYIPETRRGGGIPGWLVDSLRAGLSSELGSAVALQPEEGRCQFELVIRHGHCEDSLRILDRALACLTRRMAQLPQKLELVTSPKPYSSEPGSALNIHISLLDASGQNVFEKQGTEESPTMLAAIGGLCHFMIYDFESFAPNEESYRRFCSQRELRFENFIPGNVSWGVNTRSTAVRVLPGSGGSGRHIEHRVSGSDASPQRVVFCLSRAIYFGLSEAMDPPEKTIGNPFGLDYLHLPPFPRTLFEAQRRRRDLESFFAKYEVWPP